LALRKTFGKTKKVTADIGALVWTLVVWSMLGRKGAGTKTLIWLLLYYLSQISKRGGIFFCLKPPFSMW